MKIFGFLALVLSISLMTGCSFFKQSISSGPRKADANLTEGQAKLRSELISKVNYVMDFDLTDKDNFSGKVTANFELKSPANLTVDFTGGEILVLTVNGTVIDKVSYNKFFFNLPKAFLKKGANTFEATFKHPYSKTGAGLYRFVDTVDNTVYIYSDFEPFDANHMFPCFDQPDLKATYALNVTVPKAWQVVTSTRESDIKVAGKGTKQWIFPKSAKFSTYLISLHAGDYHVWSSEAKTSNHAIPLRLFVRKSFAKFVKTEDWFGPTKDSFVFLENYFGYPYPYKKYDQLIVPDFNAGAMENVAAVTFREGFVSRGKKLRSQRRGLANTIFHEMAHMWFGNLVTMQWWNDLWLNESFATYMANKGLVEGSQYKENWQNFYTRTKQWAYWTDQLVTTHPIETDVASTGVAFSIFDGITYGKGASSLKQLNFFVGDENFKKGLQWYFKTYAEKNTTRSDFMGAIEKASGKNMKGWTEKWLKTASLNTVTPSFQCKDGKITDFSLTQMVPKDYPHFRPHKTRVALLKADGAKLKVFKTADVDYDSKKTTVKEFKGAGCPDLVYPNYEDYDYVKIKFDNKSLETVKNSLAKVEDSFLRSMMWANIWEMTRDQQLPVTKFLEVVTTQGLAEKDLVTLKYVLQKTNTAFSRYFPNDDETWRSRKEQTLSMFEAAFALQIKAAKSDEDRQKVWFDAFVRLAESKQAQKLLVDMLDGKFRELSFTVDQDRRWNILYNLGSLGHSEAVARIEKEKAKDVSARGKKQALAAMAGLPGIGAKKKMLARVMKGPESESLGDLKAIMSGLFPANQKAQLQQLEGEVYKGLKSITTAASPNLVFVKSIVGSLAPTFCKSISFKKLDSFVNSIKLPKVAEKQLKIEAQEDRRCVAVKEYTKKAG